MSNDKFLKHSENQQKINAFGYRCVKLLQNCIKKKSKETNVDLFELFFHELVCFYSSAYITILTQIKSNKKTSFPFVNSRFITDPNAFQIQAFKQEPIPFYFLFFKLNFWSKKTLWVSSNLRREEKISLFKKAWNVQIKIEKTKKLTTKLIYYQFFLKKITQISKALELPFSEKHIQALDLYFKQYICFEGCKPISRKNDFLLAGSNLILTQRIASANFLKDKGNVISFGHGFASISIIEEPAVEYGEMKYSSSYIDFGKYPFKKQSNNILVLKRTSSHIQKIHNKKNTTKTKKLLYVPTSFSSYKTYAPYRNLYDAFYIDWQKTLMESLNKNNVDYMIKSHPKSIQKYPHFSEHKLEKETLEMCFDCYDGFIFDYVSTALSEALATHKKIIFFDIGNRHISTKALKCIKTDSIFKKIVFDKPLEDQISSVFSLKKERQFSYINNFSLGGTTTAKILKEIVK